jgi:hypothetical protein
MTYYPYILEKDVQAVRDHALKIVERNDDFWLFCHSVMMELVEAQGGKQQDTAAHGRHCDGFYELPNTEFDVCTAATRLQIMLETRDEFLRDRSENAKSG